MLQESFFGAIKGYRPRVAEGAFVAPATVVVGRVSIGARSSVWYGSVLRGDDEEVVVGEDCNIQDLCMMHADPGYPIVLGNRVSVGHRAIVHSAQVEDDCLIGMGAILLNGARVGSGSVVAAGAVVTPGTNIPEDSLAAGVPAKVIRPVGKEETEMVHQAADSYVRKSDIHRRVDLLSVEEVIAL